MARYRIDCFYRAEDRLEPLPRHRKPYVAADDDDAVKVANSLVTLIKPEPAYFQVRALTRKEPLIHTSPVKGDLDA